MKSSVSRQPRGFTLVELLVVIAIIAVLASAGFAAANAAIQKARKTTALATATALESAVNNFFNDYGTMPKEGSSDGAPIQTDTDTAFLNVLLGNDDTLNPRGIRFLSVKEGKGNKNGLIYSANGNSIEGLYDPWGGPFFVLLDLDLNEKVSIPSGVLNGARTLNGRRVAVWSRGADFEDNNKPTDDVITWGN
jgi:prepilin-type N-terminal cleavage/methylation domain-containing protein